MAVVWEPSTNGTKHSRTKETCYSINTYTILYMHIYIYIYMCVCVCVCINIHTFVYIIVVYYYYHILFTSFDFEGNTSGNVL